MRIQRSVSGPLPLGGKIVERLSVTRVIRATRDVPLREGFRNSPFVELDLHCNVNRPRRSVNLAGNDRSYRAVAREQAMVETLASLLITDDDRAWRETLRQVFTVHGFQTWLAADGEEALHIVHRERVDLLLADMHMPRLSGLELLRRLQRFQTAPPAILVTSDWTESLREEALRASAVDVLRKPLRLGQLVSTVQRVLQERSGR